jgi:hypothetical protein
MSDYPREVSCLRCGARLIVVSKLAALICRPCIDEVTAQADRERSA